MREVVIQNLTRESFAPFGTYYDMKNPSGLSLNGELHRFFPDRLSEAYPERLGFSSILVKKPAEMLIKQVEHHFTTPELILPLNDDMIIHVSPATADYPNVSQTKAFLVPCGTLVKIATAIWHLVPLPVNGDMLSAMIVLPETVYARDCPVISLKEEDYYLLKRE